MHHQEEVTSITKSELALYAPLWAKTRGTVLEGAAWGNDEADPKVRVGSGRNFRIFSCCFLFVVGPSFVVLSSWLQDTSRASHDSLLRWVGTRGMTGGRTPDIRPWWRRRSNSISRQSLKGPVSVTMYSPTIMVSSTTR